MSFANDQKEGIFEKSIRRSPYNPQFYNTGLNIDSKILKKSTSHSPIPLKSEPDSFPLTSHQIIDPNKADK